MALIKRGRRNGLVRPSKGLLAELGYKPQQGTTIHVRERPLMTQREKQDLAGTIAFGIGFVALFGLPTPANLVGGITMMVIGLVVILSNRKDVVKNVRKVYKEFISSFS